MGAGDELRAKGAVPALLAPVDVCPPLGPLDLCRLLPSLTVVSDTVSALVVQPGFWERLWLPAEPTARVVSAGAYPGTSAGASNTNHGASKRCEKWKR